VYIWLNYRIWDSLVVAQDTNTAKWSEIYILYNFNGLNTDGKENSTTHMTGSVYKNRQFSTSEMSFYFT
jgi:hypothetical protein